jgi:hypothetical protein
VVNENNFGIFADALTVSVDGSETFTVTFKAEKAGKLSEMVGVSSRITKAEGYSLTDGRMDVALRFDGKTIAGVGFELYQNQPNPFVNKTLIGFHLPEAAAATLTVYDADRSRGIHAEGRLCEGLQRHRTGSRTAEHCRRVVLHTGNGECFCYQEDDPDEVI